MRHEYEFAIAAMRAAARSKVPDAYFGCDVIHPLKRWAGVQVGLSHFSGSARTGLGLPTRSCPPRSVYYDTDTDANGVARPNQE